MKLLVVIPVYNEEANIVSVVEELRRVTPQYDFIIVSDGSRDATAQICKEHKWPIVEHEVNRGLTEAFRTGIRYAKEHGYESVVQLDGDGQHDPQYLPAMERMMEEEQCDIVIGSRFLNSGRPKNLRMLGNLMLSRKIRKKTGQMLTDPTSGMRMYDGRLFDRFLTEQSFGPEPDTIARLIFEGKKVRDVSVRMRERIEGHSYLRGIKPAKYMWHQLREIGRLK